MVTYTDNKKLNKPANGEYPNTWDVPVNQDWDIIDKALGSAASFTVGATDITLTIDEAQNQRIVLTGFPSASRSIIIPFKYLSATTAVGGMWIVDNQSNATQNIVTEAAGSVGVAIPTGKKALVYSDGTDIKFADDSRITAGTGLTLTGNSLAVTSPVTAAIGGTGYAGGYSSGQLLIGKADGTLAKTTLTAGTNITITNGDGTITIDSTASGGGGGLSSISFSGTSGLTFTPSTLNSTNTSTVLGGTLGVANGGTGVGGAGFATAGFIKTVGTTAAFTSVATVNLATEVSNTLAVANGGTGTTSSIGTGSVVLSSGPTFTGLINAANIQLTTGSYLKIGSNANFSSDATNTSINFTSTTSFFGAAGFISTSVGGVQNTLAQVSTFTVASGITPQAYGTTTFTNVSDSRVKKNVQTYSLGIDALNQLQPITYQFNGLYGTKDDGKEIVGLVAQDVQQTPFNSMVCDWKYTNPNTGQITDLLSLNTSELVFALINAVKDLDARVKALEAQIGPS